MIAQDVSDELKSLASTEKAQASARFFKTGHGQYGEGDKFLGVTVPQQRKIARKYHKGLSPEGMLTLLKSPWHEERLTALFMLVLAFQKGDQARQDEVANLYLANTKYVNNWDLVDSSAGYILGPWLAGSPYKMQVLTRLAKSKDLWERRIAMIATQFYINSGSADEALVIAELLVNDSHDLIQKAVGWMLRELGKRVDRQLLLDFLDRHAVTMPRTALRYAIEHLPPDQRRSYMERGGSGQHQ